ncbi:MAG TPA: hypothetical protein EYP10_12640 [Armatimonadetes bacterium]|nr:hypothetical protein [Armatimonadota bacterium]
MVEEKASSQATTALVLGIIGLVCCQLLAPVAWYIGAQELKAIEAGTSPRAGEGVAKAGWILGIIGTVLLCIGIIASIVQLILVVALGGMQ